MTVAAPSQLTLTSGISEAVRTKIARKKEEAMTLAINTKKHKEEAIKKKKTGKKVIWKAQVQDLLTRY